MFFHVLSPSVLIIALAFIASVQAAPVASSDAPCVLGAPYVCTRDVASSVDAPESAEGSASGREEITMPFMLWTPIPRPNATRRDDVSVSDPFVDDLALLPAWIDN